MDKDNRSRLTFRFAVAIASLAVFVHVLFALIAAAAPSLGTPVHYLAALISSCLAASGLVYGGRYAKGYGRLFAIGWTALMIAQVADMLGNFIRAALYFSSRPIEVPGVVDLFFVLFFPFLTIGVLLLLSALFQPHERLKLLFDTGIIILGSIQVAWVFVVGSGHTLTDFNSSAKLVELASVLIPATALAIVFITAVKFALSWPPSAIPAPVMLLIMGVAIETVTDLITDYQFSQEMYWQGSLAKVGWTIGNGLIGLAGIWLATTSRTNSNRTLKIGQLRYTTSSWFHYTPLLWVVVAYFVIIWNRDHPLPIDTTILELGMGGIVILSSLRQLLVMQENVRLYAITQKELTERTRAEETLRQLNLELTEANQKLQELDQMKDQFVSNVSHEIRTPFANIKLYLHLLERGKPEKHQEYLQTLHREATRLGNMIDELLDLSRIDRGSTSIELRPTDLNGLLSQLLIDRSMLADERGLTLSFQSTPDLPPALVDPTGLAQVISNILTNAINYTPSGGTITISSASQQQNEYDWITVTIQDTGPGIARQDLPHLFERFYRGEAGRKAAAPGTGLGLAISKALIERWHGHITVKSEPGHGATFTIWLQQALLTQLESRTRPP